MPTIPRQQGFTLIEVLAVMLVLVAIATITVESSKDFVFQNRYQVTQDRYDKIKQAIIGNPNQVVNGQPNISGFVADMGRLPNCLRELIDGYCAIGACSDGSNASQTTCTAQWVAPSTPLIPVPVQPNAYCGNTNVSSTACTGSVGIWITGTTGTCSPYSTYNNNQNACKTNNGIWTAGGICATTLTQANCTGNNITWIQGSCYNNPTDQTPHYSQQDCTNNSGLWTPYVSLIVGWRGGYIETTGNPNQPDALTDGWGRTAQGYCSNPSNIIGSGFSALYSTANDCHNAGYVFQGIDDNYGWGFDNSNNQLTLRSYGKDQTATIPAIATPSYDNDYPLNIAQPLVAVTDWLQSTPVIINVMLTPASNSSSSKLVCLDFRFRTNGQIAQVMTAPVLITETGQQTPVPFTLPTTITLAGQTAPFTQLPIGKAAFRIADCSAYPSAISYPTYPISGRDFTLIDILPNKSPNFYW